MAKRANLILVRTSLVFIMELVRKQEQHLNARVANISAGRGAKSPLVQPNLVRMQANVRLTPAIQGTNAHVPKDITEQCAKMIPVPSSRARTTDSAEPLGAHLSASARPAILGMIAGSRLAL